MRHCASGRSGSRRRKRDDGAGFGEARARRVVCGVAAVENTRSSPLMKARRRRYRRGEHERNALLGRRTRAGPGAARFPRPSAIRSTSFWRTTPPPRTNRRFLLHLWSARSGFQQKATKAPKNRSQNSGSSWPSLPLDKIKLTLVSKSVLNRITQRGAENDPSQKTLFRCAFKMRPISSRRSRGGLRLKVALRGSAGMVST